MTQAERRIYLIKELLAEQPRYQGLPVPTDTTEQKRLFRSLMNIRGPRPIDQDFLAVQDEYLQGELAQKGVTDFTDLTPVSEGIYLWQGDITTLRCDAIVNAANSGMTGCYVPCHSCIDNCIHTYAGVQLRQECAAIMREQGREEETGRAKITSAYNLPCKYILHTVGPIISGPLTRADEELLASCYRSCLELAEQYSVKSIAFCCISTGEFHFPNDRAAEIAVRTVKEYRAEHESEIQVIFNVFKDVDYKIYQNLLAAN
ncbi:protein-ADP-ribose hydrolase [Pseudoflavonifractor sp. 60]|uniref:protein-ADP-ribose hydrolase n=1 Tax=Pseudoflavonifractor sp. 60 TaxID=2304576 RepID=UPI00136991AE|nr:protein-ADP-ribose hydrolase [Pseudoflavonifractor sp. 60]NBI67218.1 protein-ADP-ribose hydrolase [Pseudoflavonifractor sp. 60]